MTAFRDTLANTLRFDTVLRTILSTNWDANTSLVFDPTSLNINAETARARLRDAILSLLSFKTTLPNFDVERLRSMRALFYITTDESGRVLILPKTKKEPTSTLSVDVVAGGRAVVSPVVLDPQTPQFDARLRAFALLLGSRDLTTPVRVRGTLPPDLEQELISNYDVAILPDGDFTLIL